MESFSADILRFVTKKHQNLAFWWTTGYWPSNPTISGVLIKFPNFLRWEVLIRLITREETDTFTFS